MSSRERQARLDSPSRPADPVTLVAEFLLGVVPVVLLLMFLSLVVHLISNLGLIR